MRVVLFSDDQQIYDLCRSIFADYRVANRQLILAEPELPLPEADLYIWDGRSAMDLGPKLAASEPNRHLLLVERKDMAGAAGASFLGTMVVLKPVTKAALAAWLVNAAGNGHAVPRTRNIREGIVEALFESNLRLQEYDQDRTNFLATVIHDFRAPLTATSGYCNLLLDGQLGPLTDLQREVLSRTQNSLKRLSRMTSSMFHLAVGHRVQIEPNLESRDFRECIDQALHEIRPLANERSIQVSTNLRPPTQMHFDHGQMVQVLMNLLENACKFTPKMGHIGISGYPYFWERRSDGPRPAGTERRTRNGSVLNAFRVDVCNTGPEIRPERLNRVFEEYTSYGVGQEGPASGLGLAICKRFVQQHKGRIWAENQLGGPTLSFVLPFQATVPSNQNSAAEIGGQKTIDGDFKKCGQISAEQ